MMSRPSVRRLRARCGFDACIDDLAAVTDRLDEAATAAGTRFSATQGWSTVALGYEHGWDGR
jgi:hypothetical protein